MEHFDKADYQTLLDVRQGPAVSIYVPAQRVDNKGKNNQLVYRAQVDRALELLAERYEPKQYREIAQKMEAHLNNSELWGSLTHGAAAFFAPDFERIYRLHQPVLAETVLSDTFHTRPMLRVLSHPQHYWVLALDAKDTRLYEVHNRDIQQVGMDVIPTNVEEALSQPYPLQQQGRRREVTSAQGNNASVHGVGPGRDASPDLLRQYAQVVDARLQKFLDNKTDPLILGAAGQLYSLFQEESTLENLFAKGLQESLAHRSTADIRESCEPILDAYAAQQAEGALNLWEREYGRGQAEIDLQQIARRTLMSQVRYLFIEKGRRIWGQLNREDGTISVSGENGENRQNMQNGEADILDELTEFVLSRGGEVFVVPEQKMPSETGAAAILRGLGPIIHEESPRARLQ